MMLSQGMSWHSPKWFKRRRKLNSPFPPCPVQAGSCVLLSALLSADCLSCFIVMVQAVHYWVCRSPGFGKMDWNTVCSSEYWAHIYMCVCVCILAVPSTHDFNTLRCPFCSLAGNDWRVGRMRHAPVLQWLQLSSDILAQTHPSLAVYANTPASARAFKVQTHVFFCFPCCWGSNFWQRSRVDSWGEVTS